MRQNVFSSDKETVYEKLLKQATMTKPMATFDTPEGKKGIYRLPENIVRTFLVLEVERKRREVSERDSGHDGRNNFEQSL